MARSTSALLGKNTAYGKDVPGRVADLGLGGTEGWAPDVNNIYAAQAYLRQPGIHLLLDIPDAYKAGQNSIVQDNAAWAKGLRSLLETAPSDISGFNATITTEKAEHQMGNSGSLMMQIPKESKMALTTISTTYDSDRMGQPIHTMLDHWQRWLLRDPHTRYALMHSFLGTTDDPSLQALMSMYSASSIFIQPDQTGKICTRAWYNKGLWPTGSGEILGNRSRDAMTDLEPITVEWASMTFINKYTQQLGQLLLDEITSHGYHDPGNIELGIDTNQPYSPSIPGVLDGDTSTGYRDSVFVTKT